MPTPANETALLLELHYLPSVAYMAQLLRYEQVVIEACEHYQKRSYRNRINIATSHGALALSIPLKSGKNAQQAIRETQISYDHPWQKQHWQTIVSAYGNAPFWEHYAPHFTAIFQTQPVFLFDWNWALLQLCLKLLKVKDVNIEFSTTYQVEPNAAIHDMRNLFHPRLAPPIALKPYSQVFLEKTGFVENLSVLDLLFCCGNQSLEILSQ
jgi:WbqC-like protein family